MKEPQMLSTVIKNVARLHMGNRGATAVEYGLIAALIAVAIAAAVTTLGTFGAISGAVSP